MLFNEEVRAFFTKLGIATDMTDAFLSSGSTDYTRFLGEIGAFPIKYRESLRKIQEVGHRGLILPGGNVVTLTVNPDFETCILLQERAKEGTFGCPGGAVEVWEYRGTQAVEPTVLCAYREFNEEVGCHLDVELSPYGENFSTIAYPNGDVAFGCSFFYKVTIPYEEAKKFEIGGSDEGSMTLIKLYELRKFPWFDNHAPILSKLLDEYGF